MKITLAQLNPTVGDVAGNAERAEKVIAAAARTADLVVFPELYLVGYPPRDLLKNTALHNAVAAALRRLKRFSKKYPRTGILIGLPVPVAKGRDERSYNAAVLIYRGMIIGSVHKLLLPTYDVFDEVRYFEQARDVTVIPFKNERLGITICEDMWNERSLWQHERYTRDPVAELAGEGATILINISASPYFVDKEKVRMNLMKKHARRHRLPFIFVNQVGANDELIFDGNSMAFTRTGAVSYAGTGFTETVGMIDTRNLRAKRYTPQPAIASLHDALVLGIKDYIRKCGFTKVILGLSGGIDSALTCVLAAKALGKENVHALSMPSPFSSEGSVNDSRALARNVGIACDVVPIGSMYDAYTTILKPYFSGHQFGLAEENLQARIRGNLLMAFSNKFGYLVLSTGNKSELAVGYCTLYGDMSGGLSVIADVPKTVVYKLARYINRKHTIIPPAIIDKVPSAELRPNQTDQDTLPPYEILDAILAAYVEKREPAGHIIRRGFDKKTVEWVIRTVNRNEYKRRQAAPGLKVTSKAFGMGRRIPIAAKY